MIQNPFVDINNPMIIALSLAIITAIIGPILVAKYKAYQIKKNTKKDPLISSIESNKLVDEQLKEIKEKLFLSFL